MHPEMTTNNDIEILAQFTEQEIADMGRAMERHGFSDLKLFIKWTAKKAMASILADK